jgi:hypothetical protein
MSLVFIANRNRKNIVFKITITLAFLLMVMVAGLRSQFVGTDTGQYVRSFQSDRVVKYNPIENPSRTEIGYLFIEKTARTLSDNYWVLLTLIAAIVVFFNLKVIIKLSANYTTSIFVFLTLGVYLFFFNGARQGIAASIFGISIIYLLKGDFIKYVLWVLFAALFHKTVLIALPAYFLIRSKYSLKKIILSLVLSLVLISSWVYLIKLFPGFLSDHYLAYIDRGATGGYLLTFFYFVMSLFFIVIRKHISTKDKSLYDVYLNLTLFHTLIYVVIFISGEDISMLRLAHYFSFGFVLIWPIIFRNLKLFNNLFPRFLFVAIHLLFFYIYISKMSSLAPYYFNPYL